MIEEFTTEFQEKYELAEKLDKMHKIFDKMDQNYSKQFAFSTNSEEKLISFIQQVYINKQDKNNQQRFEVFEYCFQEICTEIALSKLEASCELLQRIIHGLHQDQLQILKFSINAIYMTEKQTMQNSFKEIPYEPKTLIPYEDQQTQGRDFVRSLMEQQKNELEQLNMKIKNQTNLLKEKENTLKKNDAQIYTLQETMEYLKLLNQTLMVQIVQLTKEKQQKNLTADFSPFQIVKLIEIASQTDKLKQIKDQVLKAKLQNKQNEQIMNQPAIDINTIIKLNKYELENFIKQQIILLEDKNEKLGLGLNLTQVQDAFMNNSPKTAKNFSHEGLEIWMNEGRTPRIEEDDEIELNEILIGKKKVLQIANDKAECNKAGIIMQSILNGLNKTERSNFNLDG